MPILTVIFIFYFRARIRQSANAQFIFSINNNLIKLMGSETGTHSPNIEKKCVQFNRRYKEKKGFKNICLLLHFEVIWMQKYCSGAVTLTVESEKKDGFN